LQALKLLFHLSKVSLYLQEEKRRIQLQMLLTKEKKSQIIKEFGGNEKNTGSSEAQVAMLTERINHISSHLETQKKDFNSARNLMKSVGRRKQLLKYLHDTNLNSYRQLIEKLNLRK
jgi:small subunit ribosomal protein S15